MNDVGYVLLFAGMILGLAIIPFGFPGTILIFVSILIYAISTHFAAGVGVAFFVVLCILTVISETADNWLSAISTRHYGGSSSSMWLSLFGGLLGAIVLGGPLALIFGFAGPIFGGFAGAFLVVFVNEYGRQRDVRQALRAGWGTFMGRMAGVLLKFVIAVTMIIAVAVSILLR